MMHIIRKKETIKLLTWIGLVLMLVVYFFSMFYGDIDQTQEGSLILLDCLWEGKLFEFYYEYPGLYFIPVFVIFAIWNFPVWIMSRFFGKLEITLISRLWSKGLVVLFAVGCIWMIYCTLKKLEYVEKEKTIFLFVSSLLFICPALAVAQYDVIEIFFMLAGIYFYIKDERLSWHVILLFSVAISVKLFAVFVFLILILMTEKRFLYILGKMILGFSFTGITMLPFWFNGFGEGGVSELSESFAERLFTSLWPGGTYGISLFFLGYFTICLIAYLSNEKSIQKNFRLLIWMVTAFFLVLLTFVHCYPYWYILIVPFLSILVAEYKENLKINYLLMTVMEITIIWALSCFFPWVLWGENAFSYLVFQNIGVNGQIESMADIVERLGMSFCTHGAFTMFFWCGMALLVLNNPWRPVLVKTEERNLIVAENVARVARFGIVVLYFIIGWAIAFWI